MKPQQSPEPSQGIVRFYDFLPEGNPFLDDVLEGFSRQQKRIPPKYFFDTRSPRLLEALCELPDFYPVSAETAIMRAHMAEMAQFVGPDAQVIELGSGAGVRSQVLVEGLRPPLYVPIDTDAVSLVASAEALSRQFPWLNISGMCADYSSGLVLPEFVGLQIRRKVVFCPSHAWGSLTHAQAHELMQRVRRLAGSAGALLIGVNLKRERPGLDAAYTDPRGVAAQVNLNLLMRINRELGADFQPLRFAHRASCHPATGRIDMYLESLYEQFVRVAGRRIGFALGETIHTGTACGYALAEFHELARGAGLVAEKIWSDAQPLFAVHAMIVS